MDTKYLTYILTIAKRQNMTKAAEDLFVSQSSLSQYLSKLENELGTALFYRSKGSLTSLLQVNFMSPPQKKWFISKTTSTAASKTSTTGGISRLG